ncbi:MAG: aminoacyl-tRNA deacylase [Anaerolineae bacterium]|nr:aminoacyl-tRNA deacylase [Anaerolineae bacterium]
MARKKKPVKNLAMRVLEGQNMFYEVIEFPDTIHDATAVAEYVGLPPDHVYKTLVVEADQPDVKPMLIMIAANRSLDLKKVASAVGLKKVHMARHADAERITGLKVGGISALALLNRGFTIYIDQPAAALDTVAVSAGQRGLNLRIPVDDLIRVTAAQIIDASVD